MEMAAASVGASSTEARVAVGTADIDENPISVSEYGGDTRYGGSVSTSLPSGSTGAKQVLSVEFANAVAGERSLRWSYWTHHHYPGGGGAPMTDPNHDHSGDHLGKDKPVASLTTSAWTVEEFAHPSSYLVYQDGGKWYGLDVESQTVEFDGSDGIKVINRALDRTASREEGDTHHGSVWVTFDNNVILRSSTTLRHVHDGVGLVLGSGLRFQYTSSEEAVILAGDGLSFAFHYINSSSARHMIRDLGLSNSVIEGLKIQGCSETLWFGDAANQVHTPNDIAGYTRISLRWATPQGPYGIKMDSAPDAEFSGYRWVIPVIVGGSDTTIVLGDQSDADTVNRNVFYGDIDGAVGGAGRLVEINDSHNVIYLKDYTAAAGDEDIEIRPGATDSTVLPLTNRGGLRVKRTVVSFTDMSKHDIFKPEVRRYDLLPDSLASYDVTQTGSGGVSLASGHVVHHTGKQPESRSSIVKLAPLGDGSSSTARRRYRPSFNSDQTPIRGHGSSGAIRTVLASAGESGTTSLRDGFTTVTTQRPCPLSPASNRGRPGISPRSTTRLRSITRSNAR